MPADEVLALTFSSAAAAEMRERLESLIEVPYEELHVGTFHAFCSRLLRDEALEAGLDPFFAPVTPADRLALLLDRHRRADPAPATRSAATRRRCWRASSSRIDRLKEEMVSCRGAAATTPSAWWSAASAKTTPRGPAPRASSSSPASTPTTTACWPSSGALDFGDLVLRAFRCCTSSPHVRRARGRALQHVLVDEYQDMNFAQGMLLRPARARSTATSRWPATTTRRSTASAAPRARTCDDFEREFPDGRDRRSSSSNYRSGQRDPRRGRARWSSRPRRLEKTLKGKAGGRRALLALPVRARAGAGRGGRGRAADRPARASRPTRSAVLVRSVRRRGRRGGRRAGGARAALPR